MKRTFIAIALLSLTAMATGCHHSRTGSCAGGQCGLLGGCSDGSCQTGYDPNSNPQGAMANYAPNGGQGGPLGALAGRHHRGPQSHTGPAPGPAMGEASPTVGYPYYTTRGPRDFLNPNPPSIGR